MAPWAAREPPARASLSLCACLPGSFGSIVDPLFLASSALLNRCRGARRRLAWDTVVSSTCLEPVFLWKVTLFKDKSHDGPVFLRKTFPEAFLDSLDFIPSRSVDGSTRSQRGSRGEGVSPRTNWHPYMSGWISSNPHILRGSLAKADNWGSSGRSGPVECSLLLGVLKIN